MTEKLKIKPVQTEYISHGSTRYKVLSRSANHGFNAYG
jgi:hypothetical protein